MKKIYLIPAIDSYQIEDELIIETSGDDKPDLLKGNNITSGQSLEGDVKHIDFSDSESIW